MSFRLAPASVARLGALALLAAAAPAPAAAQTDAVATSFAGNASFAGTLAQEFRVVGGPIRITRFGAFDGGDGFSAPIAVGLFDVATGLQVGPTLQFTGSDGTASGAFRFQTLATPIDLPVGFVGRLAAWGYDGAERYYNAFYNADRLVTLNGGGLLDFGRVYYAAGAGELPTLPSGDGRGGWYGAGSFTFGASVSAVPEPATWAMLAGGLAALGLVAARRRGEDG